MKKIFSASNPLHLMALVFLLLLLLAHAYGGRGLSSTSDILLTVTSFVFGFYINNLITQARAGHTKVVEGLREEGGYLKAIYYTSQGVFSDEIVDKIRDKIDRYLIVCMDTRITDYSSTAKDFREFFAGLMAIPVGQDSKDSVSWGHIVRMIGETSKARTRIEATVKERLSLFEWITAGSLLSLVVFFVFSLNSKSGLSTVVTALIATTLAMLLVFLESLDSFRWKESKWFWEPQQELFLNLDLLPYFPKVLVDQGRLHLTKGQTVRLGDFPHPYPDLRDRKITLHGTEVESAG